MNTTHLVEWIEHTKTHYTQIDLKIFHPDFSCSVLSHINVALGVLVLLLLLLRWTFALLRQTETLRNVTNHCHGLHVWTAFVVWLFTLQEGGTALDMGLNFALFICNSNLIQCINEKHDAYLHTLAYRQAMDDAVHLYGADERFCREVIKDAKVVRAILTAIDTKLSLIDIHNSVDRREEGGRLFDELLKKERLHYQLLNSPHMTSEALRVWLKE